MDETTAYDKKKPIAPGRLTILAPTGLEGGPMPCYTTVRTQIRDLALATEAAMKLGWQVEKSSERFGQGVSAVFRTPVVAHRPRARPFLSSDRLRRPSPPPPSPPPSRRTPATLRDRGRGCGGGWESLAVAGADRQGAVEHRRAPLRLWGSGPLPPSAHRRQPGGRFFRRGRAQVVRAEIVMSRPLVSPPIPFHGRDSP